MKPLTLFPFFRRRSLFFKLGRLEVFGLYDPATAPRLDLWRLDDGVTGRLGRFELVVSVAPARRPGCWAARLER